MIGRKLSQLRGFMSRFHNSPEGRIFLFGLACGFVFGVAMLATAIVSEHRGKIGAIFFSYCAAGRLPGIATGLQLEAHPALVFLMALCLETLVTLFFYPLATFSTQEVSRLPAYHNSIGSTLAAAERFREPVRKWGVPGLLFFNWLPIYLTGPLIAALVARLIGFSHLASLVISTLGTVLSVLLWMWTVEPVLEASGEWAFLVPTVLIVGTVGIGAYHYLRRRRTARQDPRPSPPDPKP